MPQAVAFQNQKSRFPRTLLNPGRRPRFLTALAALLTLVCGFGAPASFAIADDNQSHTYRIEAQDLASALKEFAFQSQREIFFAPELTHEKRSNGVIGRYDDLSALERILRDTGLTYTVTASKAILVNDPTVKPIAYSQAQGPLRIAQAGNTSSDSTQVPQGSPERTSQYPSENPERVSLQEVVVTATKQGEKKLQDVPFAVQAMTGESIESRGGTSFNDYYQYFPGLSVFDYGPGDKRYVIRGVNSVGAGTVGVFVDEVPITGENSQDGGGMQPDPGVFDIERVEVLKGPQGTSFGSGSLAGAIRYITTKPNLSETSISVSTGMRATRGADLGDQFEATLNTPIIADELGLRVAGFYENQPGFIDAPFINGQGVNDNRTYVARVSLGFRPTDAWRVNFMYMAQDAQTRGQNYYNTLDLFGRPLSVGSLQQADEAWAPFKDRMYLYNVTGEYTASSGTVVLTASRDYRNTLFDRDASAVLANSGPRLDSTTAPTIITQPRDRTVDTLEARYASKWSGPVQVLVGGFYQNEDRLFESAVDSTDASRQIGPDPTVYLDRTERTRIKEWAAFSEVTVNLAENLSVLAGGRYYDFRFSDRANVIVSYPARPGTGVGPLLEQGDSGVIGRGNISYHFPEHGMLYAQVAQGFRAGGTNDPSAAQIANVSIPETYGSDSLVSYEAGAKTDWLDRRLTVDAAAFLIDWSNIQVQERAVGGGASFPYTGNGGGARIPGGELEIEALPLKGLQLSAAGSWVDAKLSANNPILTTGMKGDRLPYVPDKTVTLSADYAWPMMRTNTAASLGADFVYTGSQTTALRPTDPVYKDLPSYNRVNLRAGVKAAHWSVNFVLSNVFDSRATVAVFQNTAFAPLAYIPIQPRTFTMTVRTDF
jgi:outer membrane receptor protein involved in Fe transport